MNSKYKIIDMDSWKRRTHCQIFRNFLQPQYCTTVELDVSNFYKAVKKNGWSFTLAFIFAAARCANDIEEFRYRFLDDQIILYEKINASFSYIDSGDDLFKYVSIEMQDNIASFLDIAKSAISEQKEYFSPIANDTFIFSALPWFTFTHVSHTDSGAKDKANPMFYWGKFQEKDGKLMMPFSVQAHHSFVDGIHMGRLFNHIQQYLD